jgi:hypothetical protein
MNESTDTDDGRRGTLLDGPPSGDSRNHDSSHDTAHGRHPVPVQRDSGGDLRAASAATSEGTEDENVMRHGHQGGRPPLDGCHTASRPVVRHGTECETWVGSQSAGGTGGNDGGVGGGSRGAHCLDLIPLHRTTWGYEAIHLPSPPSEPPYMPSPAIQPSSSSLPPHAPPPRRSK